MWWAPFNWSRDRDLGRALRLDTTLCAATAAPWIPDPAYDARDMRSEAAANDCLDWRNSNSCVRVIIELDCNTKNVLFLSNYQLTNNNDDSIMIQMR